MKQLLGFLTVGVFNTLLGYCVIFGCMYLLNWNPEISNLTGYGLGLITSYLLHRKYTFKSKQAPQSEILKFGAVFIVAYTLNLIVLVILIHKMAVHDALSQVLAGIIYVASSFLMNKYYVFKKNPPVHRGL